MNNKSELAVAALEAASRVHQKATNDKGSTTNVYGREGVSIAEDRHVLATADAFLTWLWQKSE